MQVMEIAYFKAQMREETSGWQRGQEALNHHGLQVWHQRQQQRRVGGRAVACMGHQGIGS